MAILEQRPLGKTGLNVTCIGLGGAGLGGEFGRVKEQSAVWTIRKAMANGVNLIDVSPAYGDAELLVGKALTQSERNKTLFSTKLAFAATDRHDIERDMENSIQQSLERLRVERIDILGLHRFVFKEPRGVWAISSDAVLGPGGYLECMQKWKDKGVVRALSFTAWGDYEGVTAVLESGGFDVCEVEYSLLHRDSILEGEPQPPDRPTIMQLAAARGMGMLGIRPLAGGALANRATGNRGDAQTMRDRQRAAVLAQRLGDIPLIPTAFTYALMNPRLASVLVGCRQPEEIESAVASTRLPPHTEAMLERLEQYHEQALHRGPVWVQPG